MPVPDQPPLAEPEDSLSLLDLLGVMVKRRRLIAGVTLAGAVLIFGYVLLTRYLPPAAPWNLFPNVYRAQAKVLLQERESSGLPAALNPAAGDSTALGALLRGVGGVPSSAALAEQLLAGRTIHDRVIERFDFVNRYGFTDNPRTNARALAEQSLKYEFDATSGVMSISYEEFDAEFAAAVLAQVLQLLEQRFRALTMETVELRKQHLEERLAAVDAGRRAAQERLVEFHRTYGILDIQNQSLELAQLLAQYRRELLSKEVEMQSLRELLPAADPAVVQLRNEIDVVRQVLDELQTGFRSFTAQTIPQDDLPGVSADYLNLRGDLDLHEQIYALLRQQYELTRIDETDPARTFQVLEPVEVPEIRHWPSRARTCVVATLILFLLTVLLAFLLEHLARVRADPVEAAKLNAIRAHLGRPPRPGSAAGPAAAGHWTPAKPAD